MDASQANLAAGYHEWAAYIAHQAAEKALKVAIAGSGERPPHTHDLLTLWQTAVRVGALPVATPEQVDNLDLLTHLSVEARYPRKDSVATPGELVTEERAQRSWHRAQDVVIMVEAALRSSGIMSS